MRVEIESASNFLCFLLGPRSARLSPAQLDRFRSRLIENLMARYRDHWFPTAPFKGSGYRALRNNGRLIDPELHAAAVFAGVSPAELFARLPPYMVLWVDPFEVSYRLEFTGEVMSLRSWTGEETPMMPWTFDLPMMARPAHLQAPTPEQSFVSACSVFFKCLWKRLVEIFIMNRDS